MILDVVGQTLELENRRFCGTGGVRAENRHFGFRPAFLDKDTSEIYLSRFADGRPAPCHLWDGLPDEIVLVRSRTGRVAKIKTSIESGFARDGRFFTREEAAIEVGMLQVQHMIGGDET